MFSTGQLIFALLFFCAFVIIIFFSYQKDKKLHKKYYKGSFWILIGFIVFVLLLVAIKTYLKPWKNLLDLNQGGFKKIETKY